MIKSEGKLRKFSTGAVRDTATKKPMIHLISPFFMRDLGEHLRYACQDRKPEPYPMRNWEQGMPFSETLGSGLRHLMAELAGDKTEDHIAALGFCAMCLAHYRHEIAAGRMDPALDDLPHYPQKPLFSDGIDQFIEAVEGAEKRAETQATALVDPTRDAWNEQSTFYVTGPMRGVPQYNFPLFDEVAERARKAGYSVISPAEMDRESGIDPMVDPQSVDRAWKGNPELLQTIIQRDCEVILGLEKHRGDGLILLPGWDKSVGARAEIALALWLGLQFRECRKFESLLSEVIERELFCQEELV